MDLIDRFLRPLRGGPRTRPYPDVRPVLPASSRGFPEVEASRCDADGACVAACPTGAIAVVPSSITIDVGRCIVCAACADACPNDAITLGDRFEMASRTRDALRVTTAVGARR